MHLLGQRVPQPFLGRQTFLRAWPASPVDAPAPDRHGDRARRPVTLRDPYHQPHLQNFFDAVRGKAKLNCPSEIAYETAVAVLKVNEAIEAQSRLSFKPEDFKI